MTDFLTWWVDHWPVVPYLVFTLPAGILGWKIAWDWWREGGKRE